MEPFAARYNDGITARTRDVHVAVTSGGLDILADDGALLDRWPGEDIHLLDPKSARGAVRFGVGDGDMARLTVQDKGARAAIIERFPNVLNRRRLSWATVGRITGWSAFAAASLAFVIWVVLPFVAVQVAGMIPQSVQRKVGEHFVPQLISIVALLEHKKPQDMKCGSPAGDRALIRLRDRLAKLAPKDIDFNIQVIDARMVNAVALPGGYIVMTRGILKFVDGPNELAGVLGHEMGHVVLNHAVENMIKVGGVTTLFSLMVGDVAGGAVILAVANALVRGSFSQQAEHAADDYGVTLLNREGYDSRPFAAFFSRLADKEDRLRAMFEKGDKKTRVDVKPDKAPPPNNHGGMRDWISSHPPSRDRAQYILDLSRSGGEILSDADWKALKTICD